MRPVFLFFNKPVLGYIKIIYFDICFMFCQFGRTCGKYLIEKKKAEKENEKRNEEHRETKSSNDTRKSFPADRSHFEMDYFRIYQKLQMNSPYSFPSIIVIISPQTNAPLPTYLNKQTMV